MKTKTNSLISLGVATSMLSILALEPVNAASAPPDAKASIGRLCATKKGQAVSQFELAEALLMEAGLSSVSFAFPRNQSSQLLNLQSFQNSVVDRLDSIQNFPGEDGNSYPDTDPDGTVTGGIKNLVQMLQSSQSPLIVDGQSKNLISQPFASTIVMRPFTCKEGGEPTDTIGDTEKFKSYGDFALRQKPDELWLTGDDAAKSGSAKLGFERLRSQLDTGTIKTDRTWTVDGTVGLRISPKKSHDVAAYLFAQYNLSKARTNPPPSLDPGKLESDGDTNTLRIGYIAKLGPYGEKTPFSATFGNSYVYDFAKDAQRLNANFQLHFAPDWPFLGICNIGSYGYLTKDGSLKSRCDFFRFEAEGSRLLKRGKVEVGDFDTYLGIGISPKIELFLPTTLGNETGILASVNYRYLEIIEGKPSNIERWDLEFKHRFWTEANIGVDVGFTLAKGTNSLSLEEEDKITFGVGLVY